MKVQTQILQAIFELKRLAEWKEFESAKYCDRPYVYGSAELERGWSGGRLNRHFPVGDFDAHRLGCFVVARMFQKTGWSECVLVHTNYSRVDCDAQQSSCIRDGADKQKLLVERAGGLRSSWMDR